MTESQLTRTIVQMIRKEFPQVWFYKVCDRFRSGLPDLILCTDGHFCGIELKVGKNAPTKLQAYELQAIRKAGGWVKVCYGVDEVRQYLRNIICLSTSKK